MSRRRIDVGSVVGAGGALALAVSLFMDWYEPGRSAFAVFESLDLVLLGCAAVGVAAGLGMVVSSAVHGGFGRLTPGAGVLAVLVVASQAIDHPPAAAGAPAMTGQWIALAASAAMTVGFGLGVARISLSVDVAGRDRRTDPERRRGGDRRDRGPVSGRTVIDDDPEPRAPRRRPPRTAPAEARAAEPDAMADLYPERERSGPIGADDPTLAGGVGGAADGGSST